jgi:hypothetical protein
VCSANAYFRGEYEGGAVYLLIKDESYRQRVTNNPVARLLSVFPNSISTYEISDHREALKGYADFLGLSVESRADAIRINDATGKNYATATFDESGRLTNLAGDCRPPEPASNRGKEKIDDATQPLPISGDAVQASDGSTKLSFMQAWLRNCRKYYRGGLVVCTTAAVVVGVLTRIFASLGVAVAAGIIVALVLWFVGFIEYGE